MCQETTAKCVTSTHCVNDIHLRDLEHHGFTSRHHLDAVGSIGE